MTKRPLEIILLGDPAAGKATQAVRLVRTYHLRDFDMGAELRALARGPRRSAARRDLSVSLARGQMAPTAIARRIIRETLRATPRATGILYDGHPKMLGEAKFLERELRRRGRRRPIVIYLRIPHREVVLRTARRGRSDDAPSALARRLRYYRRCVRAANAFYRRRFPYALISGAGTRAEVFSRIRAFVDRHIP